MFHPTMWPHTKITIKPKIAYLHEKHYKENSESYVLIAPVYKRVDGALACDYILRSFKNDINLIKQAYLYCY